MFPCTGNGRILDGGSGRVRSQGRPGQEDDRLLAAAVPEPISGKIQN